MQKLLLIFAFLFTYTTADPNVRRKVKEEAGPDGGRIVNGTTAAAGDYPWFVLLGRGSKTCGGTLIAEDRVLTSATCVLDNTPETVAVGPSTISDGTAARVRCRNIHPDYHRSETSIINDVAIIKLAEPVSGVDFVTLNRDISYPAYSEQFLTTLGFGFTGNNGPLSGTLQVAQLQALTTFDCQASFPEMSITSIQHVCALSPSIGVCTGDSGGPILDRAGSDATQIGITSFTFDGCASESYPDVFTKVATYYGWIKSEIESEYCQGMAFSEAPSAAPTRAPTTASPTPAPTKECFVDTVKDALGGLDALWEFIDNLVVGHQKDKDDHYDYQPEKGAKDDKKREQNDESEKPAN